MDRSSRLTLYPSRLYVTLCLLLSFLLLGLVWRELTIFTSGRAFMSSSVDFLVMAFIPVLLVLLPWLAFYLRHLMGKEPSIHADHTGLYFNCNLWGQTYIPWLFVECLEVRKRWFSNCLVLELNSHGLSRLGFWRRFLLRMHVGGMDTNIYLSDHMYSGTADELRERLRFYSGCPYIC